MMASRESTIIFVPLRPLSAVLIDRAYNSVLLFSRNCIFNEITPNVSCVTPCFQYGFLHDGFHPCSRPSKSPIYYRWMSPADRIQSKRLNSVDPSHHYFGMIRWGSAPWSARMVSGRSWLVDHLTDWAEGPIINSHMALFLSDSHFYCSFG